MPTYDPSEVEDREPWTRSYPEWLQDAAKAAARKRGIGGLVVRP